MTMQDKLTVLKSTLQNDGYVSALGHLADPTHDRNSRAAQCFGLVIDSIRYQSNRRRQGRPRVTSEQRASKQERKRIVSSLGSQYPRAKATSRTNR